MSDYYASLIGQATAIIPDANTYRPLDDVYAKTLWSAASRSERKRFVAFVLTIMGADWLQHCDPFWRFRLFMEVAMDGRSRERSSNFIADLDRPAIELVQDHQLWDRGAVRDIWRNGGRKDRRAIMAKVDNEMGDHWLTRSTHGQRFALFCEYMTTREYADRTQPQPATTTPRLALLTA